MGNRWATVDTRVWSQNHAQTWDVGGSAGLSVHCDLNE